jgi:hypothetical protein
MCKCMCLIFVWLAYFCGGGLIHFTLLQRLSAKSSGPKSMPKYYNNLILSVIRWIDK